MPTSDPLDQFSNDLRTRFEARLSELGGSKGLAGVDIGRCAHGVDVREHWLPKQPTPDSIEGTEGAPPRLSALVPDIPPDVTPDPRVTVLVADYRLDIETSSHTVDALTLPSGPTAMQLPLRPGISIGGDGLLGGTLGMIVFDSSGQAFVLGSAHCLAVNASGCPQQIGLPTEQPADGVGNENRRVAALSKFIKDVRGDAAISAIDDRLEDDPSRPVTYCLRTLGDEDGSDSAIIGPAAISKIGQRVRKCGKTTGVTTGEIDGIGHYFIASKGDTVGFRGVRIVKQKVNDPVLSLEGDSGAVWYEPAGTNPGIGVHVGRDDEHAALACHLVTALSEFGVQVSPPASANNLVVCKAPGLFHELLNPIASLLRRLLRRR